MERYRRGKAHRARRLGSVNMLPPAPPSATGTSARASAPGRLRDHRARAGAGRWDVPPL